MASEYDEAQGQRRRYDQTDRTPQPGPKDRRDDDGHGREPRRMAVNHRLDDLPSDRFGDGRRGRASKPPSTSAGLRRPQAPPAGLRRSQGRCRVRSAGSLDAFRLAQRILAQRVVADPRRIVSRRKRERLKQESLRRDSVSFHRLRSSCSPAFFVRTRQRFPASFSSTCLVLRSPLPGQFAQFLARCPLVKE